MGLETGTFIDSLVATNPVGATDPKSQGDDHLRLIKSTILATFPSITGAVTLTHTNINDAALKSAANTFTDAQQITATTPRLILNESDQAADEKIWDVRVSASDLEVRTRTDADGTGVEAFVIERGTGTAITRFNLNEVTRVWDSPTQTGYTQISHDATDGKIITNAGDLELDPAGETVKIIGTNSASGHPRLELFSNDTLRAFFAFDDSTDVATIDSDGTLSLAANNSEAVEIQTDGGIVTPDGVSDEFGYKGAPQNTQNGNYTLVLTDAGKMIYKASGGAGETITIPANSSVAFPVGTIVVIVNDGGGDLSIAITTDTLEVYDGATGTQTLGDNNKAVIEKVTSTLWKYSATA